MKQRRYIVTMAAALLAVSVPGAGAQAQGAAPGCVAPFESIVTLRPPRLGTPTVWDASYGQHDKMVQFLSGVPVEGGTMMEVGRVLSRENLAPEKIILAEINRRGRVLTEKSFPAKDGETPVKILALKKGGWLVASNMRGGKGKARRMIRLSWYGKDAAFKYEKILQDNEFDYDSYGLAPAADGEGFIVIAHAVNHALEKDQNSVLMRFTADGSKLWQRDYRPGVPNRIEGLAPVEGGAYIAAGRILIDDGRDAGWAMMLSADGAVLWQRTYPRGGYGVLRRAVSLGVDKAGEGRGYILLGDTKPLDGGPDAAWMMAVDGKGAPQWQKYFRRPDMILSSVGLIRAADGRLAVVLNAAAVPGSGNRDHVRLLTLNARGGVMEDEAYIEGIMATAHDFAPGWNGERVVTATIESDGRPIDLEMVGNNFTIKKKDEAAEKNVPEEDTAVETDDRKKPVQKGWVFVGTALEPYKDACAP